LGGGGPAQQRPEAEGVVEGGAGAAALHGGGLVELAQALTQGMEGAEQQGGEVGDDADQAAGACQGGAEAVVGQVAGVVGLEVGEELLHAVGPLIECLSVRQGGILGVSAWLAPTALTIRLSHAHYSFVNLPL